jgi:hypothetical protein
MPMLTPTDLVAEVRFLGINIDGDDLSTSSVDQIDVDYSGFVGDSHSGLTRSACVRVVSQYPKGTEIRNTRQISALCTEELHLIANAMQIDSLSPAWLGANLVLEGLPDFSKLPPSSRLIAANGTSLVVDMENAPCRFPGEIIEQHAPGFGSLFPKAAVNKRGLTLWVERTGSLVIGDKLTLHIPPACHWRATD